MSAKVSATRGGEPPSVANLFCQAVLQEQARLGGQGRHGGKGLLATNPTNLPSRG